MLNYLNDDILNKIIVVYGEKKNHLDNIYYFTENDFNIPPGNSAFAVPLYELKQIQNSCVNGVLLQDLFVYKDISLWWFLHPTFFPKFKNTVNFTLKFLEMIEQKDPLIIILKDFSNYEVIKEICDSKKITLRYSNSSFLFFNLKKILIKKLKKIKVEKIFKNKINKRICIFNNHSKSMKDRIFYYSWLYIIIAFSLMVVFILLNQNDVVIPLFVSLMIPLILIIMTTKKRF